jgi:hypothetical protein
MSRSIEEYMVPRSCSLKLLGGIGDISRPTCPTKPMPPGSPQTAGFFFTEAEAPEVTNIRKAPPCPGTVHPTSAPACSHTRTCPEPTVRKGEIHLGTARLL